MLIELTKEECEILDSTLREVWGPIGKTSETQALISKIKAYATAMETSPTTTTRGLADINRFLNKVRRHCDATGGDKYLTDRKIEPVDVIVDWFGDAWLAGTVMKYVSRMLRTGKDVDIFKTVHYLGMLYNARFPQP